MQKFFIKNSSLSLSQMKGVLFLVFFSLCISVVPTLGVLLSDMKIEFIKPEIKRFFAIKENNRHERFYFFSEEEDIKKILQKTGIPVKFSSLPIKEGALILCNTAEGKVSAANIPYRYLKNFFLPLDINSATADDFTELPGIGRKKAQEIVKYRNETGGFFSVSQILEVKGIGIKTYEKIGHFLTLRRNNG